MVPPHMLADGFFVSKATLLQEGDFCQTAVISVGRENFRRLSRGHENIFQWIEKREVCIDKRVCFRYCVNISQDRFEFPFFGNSFLQTTFSCGS
jgi:hypothetical protein